MKVLWTLGCWWERGVERLNERKPSNKQKHTAYVDYIQLENAKRVFFFSIVHIYMLLHIYILYSSRLYPGLPCTLCHLTGFRIPLFSLVKWSQVMLLQLRTEHSLDETQHASAEKHEALLWERQKSTWTMSKEALQRALLVCYWLLLGEGGGVLRCPRQSSRQLTAQGWLRGHEPVVHPPDDDDNRPQTATFGDAVGYSLKSSFYQSCLIFFNNKSVLFKWLMIVRILPRAKCTVISAS